MMKIGCQHRLIKDLDLAVMFPEFLVLSKLYIISSKNKIDSNQWFFSSVFTTQQEPGVVQIPIGNNTGSLPDLTNLLTQFSQPIHVPLDQDDPYNLQSPFNSNVR